MKTFGEGIFDLSDSPLPASPGSPVPGSPASSPPPASPDASLFSPQPRQGDPFTEGVGVMPRWEHQEREASLNESVRATETALLAAQKAIDDAAAKASLGAEEKSRQVQQAIQEAQAALSVTTKLYLKRKREFQQGLPEFTSELDTKRKLYKPTPKGGLKSKKRKHRS